MTTPMADPISPEEFMSAAPTTSLGGNTPWAARYGVEIRRAWNTEAEQAPRSLQAHLGPSELGVECDRQVAGKFAGLPKTNHVVDPWPSTRGRGMHAHAEHRVFPLDNSNLGFLRWVTEQRVTPHPEHPGTADLYDTVEQAVVDHKFLGESTMAKIRKDPPRKYVRQLFLYGLGYFLMGLPVRRVVILAYPASAASLDGLYVWEHAWADPRPELGGAPAPDVLAALNETFSDTVRRKAQGAEILAGRARLEDIPAVPDTDECYFCDFYRPQAGHDGGPGCPGTVSRR